MLTELAIGDLGVIASARLEFAPGLTAVTGETGAGKTMIVTGLGLLLGQRADAGVVRRGADAARVEGHFADVPQGVRDHLEDLGGELDENDELLVTRAVRPGRSRSRIGGAAVPTGHSAEVVAELLTIHGQSEQVRLSRPERQRELLDRSGGEPLTAALAHYRNVWSERQAVSNELAELTENAAERARELDMLRFGLDEIGAVDPQPGEDAALADEARRLQDVDALRLAAQSALVALAGADDDIDAACALTAASTAHRALEGTDDPDLQGFATRAQEIAALAADLAGDLASYRESLSADPARLEEVMARIAALGTLTRKYGATTDDVRAWAQDAAARVTGLDAGDDRVEELRTRLAELDADLAAAAAALTAERRRAADELATAVRAELVALALPHAELFFTLDRAEPGPHGADAIALMFTANPGAEARPVGKAASGGELSRIRLALEVVLAGHEPGGTFVFDEVDAGIGGAVAIEVGRRLARLARHSQVIVVTHLAQVAAFADRHHVVVKASDGAVTTSGVRTVADDDRAAELARMMAGMADSTTAIAHARELLTEARSIDSGIGSPGTGGARRRSTG